MTACPLRGSEIHLKRAMAQTTFSRVYQGRVSRATLLSKNGRGKNQIVEESEVPGSWEKALWDHHCLFQDGVNYYLLALIASGRGAPELSGIEEEVEACWKDFRIKGGNRRGMGKSVSKWLGLNPAQATFAQACEKVLEGSEASPEVRRSAVVSLLRQLHKKRGEGKETAPSEGAIRNLGREALPKFCTPSTGANFKGDPQMLLREHHLSKFPHVLAISGLSPEDSRLEEFTIFSIATRDNKHLGKKGKEAAEYLVNCLEQLGIRIPALADPAKALAERLRDRTDIDIPAYVGSSAKGPHKIWLEAMMVWQFGERSELTLELLKRTAPDPKGKIDDLKFDAEAADKAQDPIKLARGTRGCVFPAFTALPAWGESSDYEPNWSELDIAMFKEALKVLNQYKQQTEKREAERGKVERQLAYMRRDLHEWDEAEDGDAPPVLPPDDELVKLLLKLEKVLLPPEVSDADQRDERVRYSFSERALRGSEELMEKWQKIAPNGHAFSGDLYTRLKRELDDHQVSHRESLGSASLFNCLIGGVDLNKPCGEFWRLWQDPDTCEILRHWSKKQELEDELLHLSRPIRFTPADPEHSRRLFMASDLNGASAAVHQNTAVDISIAFVEEGRWVERRVRLHYSAPRLARDHISTDGAWLSPKLAAMLRIDQVPQQDFQNCAVALMPEPRNQARGIPRRFLLNFPLSLDVTDLPGRPEREQRWKGQFNAVEDTLLHLHWPRTKNLSSSKVVKESVPWWQCLTRFSCLGVDLGQRVAAAAARIEVTSEPTVFAKAKTVWEIGAAEGRTWRARLSTMRMLRLPGEEAQVWDGTKKLMRTEDYGSRGRPATEAETWQAQGMLDRLGVGDEFRLILKLEQQSLPPEVREACLRTSQESIRFFPAQNDHLLRGFKRAQGRLMRLQGWLYLIREKGEEGRARVKEELSDVRPEFLRTNIPIDENPYADLRAKLDIPTPDWQALDSLLEARILRMREVLQREISHLADRVAPLRNGYWKWEALSEEDAFDTGEKTNYRLSRNRFSQDECGHGVPKVRGQRGLSLPRIEQLEELRRRCQSLNRALKRGVGEAAKFGARLRGMEVPDPCPDLADKLDHLREQRVNQTAHLILAEALGLRLKAPSPDRALRRERDIHGEWEKVFEPVDFIVIEDLNRYLTSQGRAPSENSRLMKWCHRQITLKLKQLCEPLGLPVVEVNAAYSSRFCSRSGVAGFRAVSLSPADKHRYPFKRLLAEARDKGTKASDEARYAAEFFTRLEARTKPGKPPPTALWPKAGGPTFVPVSNADNAKPMQADLNAAINIALRGIVAPECIRHLHKLRAIVKDGQLVPRVENLRERALFDKRNPALFQPPPSGFWEVRKDGANVFLDTAGIARFDQTRHPAFPGNSLATGKALWSSVKAVASSRCAELNEGETKADSIPL